MSKNRKYKYLLLLGIICLILIFIILIISLLKKNSNNKEESIEIVGMDINEVEEYYNKLGNDIEIKYEYNEIDKDKVIKYTEEDNKVILVVSKGKITKDVYKEYNVNELGEVPIMMYHGIVNMNSNDTKYIGGNVDKDGYNRTSGSFKEDLEFYYNKGYRMIRLEDYIDGNIDVELGKSPIILTFDDGNENNFKVLGKDDNGNLIIDPNCAVGILESFKEKYPDYNVTATFFVNSTLFNQKEYNEDILKWLVNNGYDIGNHTMTHIDFKTIDSNKTIEEVGGIYKILDNIIPDKYINVVALPYGSPYNKEHDNYSYIIDGSYQDINYHTKATLRVGWKSEVSCFDKNFDPTFLKRIRAYDNNGTEFDIEMNFNNLESNKYISDGDINTIVVKEEDKDNVNDSNKEIITY